MKKLLLLITGLLLLFSVEGQILRYSNYVAPAPETPSSDPPSFITSDTKTLMWFMATDSVVMDGSNLVRRWGDYLNSTKDLLQATETNQPTFVAGTGGTDSYIDFNGSDNWMFTNTFSGVVQPQVIYIVVYIDSWTDGDAIFDGGTSTSRLLRQTGTAPAIRNYNSGDTKDASVDNWHIIRVLFNGASGSLFYVDDSSGAGPTDTSSLTGFSLGANRSTSNPSDIWVKEIIIRNNDDTGDNFSDIYNYLKAKYGL